jgi:hypothetical protein
VRNRKTIKYDFLQKISVLQKNGFDINNQVVKMHINQLEKFRGFFRVHQCNRLINLSRYSALTAPNTNLYANAGFTRFAKFFFVRQDLRGFCGGF